MKKVLLGILLGFLLHKGLATTYSYSFNTKWDSAICSNKNFDKEIQCIHEKMGIIYKLHYLLIDFIYENGKWRLT